MDDQIGYRDELAGLLATLVQLWSSSRFRDAIVDSTGVGLGTTDARLLWELAGRGPSRPGLLASELGVGASSITKAVARLAARRLVQTSRDPADGRAALLSLTEPGREAAIGLYRVGDEMLHTLVTDWPPSDVDRLRDLLRRLVGEALAYAQVLEGETAAPD